MTKYKFYAVMKPVTSFPFSVWPCRTLKTNSPRVRFAPSPTGFLHLGGLRTALYNKLFAKSRGGSFILRIEDTDQTRKVEGSVEALVQDLEWAGIHCDEGPCVGGQDGPYIQSERLEIYQKYVTKLLEIGAAYRCFCTERRLNLIRRDAVRSHSIPKYDNRCRNLSLQEVKEKMNAGAPHCIRLKLSSDCQFFEDLIFGGIAYDVSINEGDPVLMKSDGFPTYHFANVVDDHLMRITHVLRGVEWQISTTKHLLIYKAFGWKPPQFGHLPLIVNADGTKLSKRQSNVKVEDYKRKGVFPLALVNYITLAGGGFDHVPGAGIRLKSMDDLAREVIVHYCQGPESRGLPDEVVCKPSIARLAKDASQAIPVSAELSKISSHPSRLNPDLLEECNKLEIRRRLLDESETENLVARLQRLVQEAYPTEKLNVSHEHVKGVLEWATTRISRLEDLVTVKYGFLWILPSKIDHDEINKDLLEKLIPDLESLSNYDQVYLKQYLRDFCTKHGIKFPILMKMLRSVLSGLAEGPGVAEMMQLLGKRQSLLRIKSVIQ